MKRLILLTLLLAGCTDAEMARVSAFGEAGHVTCYSGGRVIYDGNSTGVIHTEEKSDGWFFKDEVSGKLIRVSADCVIEN